MLKRLRVTVALIGLLAPAVAAPAGAATTSCPAAPHNAVRTAPGGGRTIALTFDDGPGPYTPRVLEILRAKGVRATFFLIGNNVPQWPAYARQVAAEGHLIGNHTETHPHMAELSRAAQKREVDRAGASIRSATGVRPCVFRPPYGNFNRTTVEVAGSRRMSTIMWSVSTNDWAQPKTLTRKGTRKIIANAKAAAKDKHPVLLMHDGGHQRPSLVAALPAIIDYFKARGYRFVDLHGGTGLRPKPATVVNWRRSPAGKVDSVTRGRHSMTVAGSVADPDAPQGEVLVQVRADAVVRATRWTRNGRFRITVPIRSGDEAVCVTAVNVGPGALGGLGCAGV